MEGAQSGAASQQFGQGQAGRDHGLRLGTLRHIIAFSGAGFSHGELGVVSSYCALAEALSAKHLVIETREGLREVISSRRDLSSTQTIVIYNPVDPNDFDIRILVERCPNVEIVSIVDAERTWAYCPGITDEGLRHFARLQKLTSLTIGACESITDAGMVHLAKFSHLRKLSFCCPQVTNRGIEFLKDLPLQDLTVIRSRMTDEGLAFLGRMKTLKKITLLLNHGITRGGVLAFYKHASDEKEVAWKPVLPEPDGYHRINPMCMCLYR
jgi:hypothetical protein